jgi:hypothetical protein
MVENFVKQVFDMYQKLVIFVVGHEINKRAALHKRLSSNVRGVDQRNRIKDKEE